MKLKRTNHIPYLKYSLMLCVVFTIVACSRKNDTWMNRNFHAMGTYYNILYHGNEAMDLGEKQIKENYVDDYWQILPVERIGSSEDSTVYGKMVDRDELRVLRRPPSTGPKSKNNEENSKSDETKKQSQKSKSSKNEIADAFSNFDNNAANNSTNNQGNGFGNDNQSNQFGNQSQPNRGQNNSMNNGGNMQNPQNDQFGNQLQPNQGQNDPMNNRGGMQNPQNGQGGMNNPNGQNIGGGQNGQPNNQNRNFQNAGGQNTVNQGGQNGGQFGNQFGGQTQPLNNGNGNLSNMSSMSSGQSLNANSGAARGQIAAGRRGIDEDPENQLSSKEAFERAEDKATKAIQKHNMLIDGVEHNPLMKDAFLLLGQSRYYNQRYFPALEAFNYILQKYEDEKYLTAAQIWKEKVYMRLESYERVIKKLPAYVSDQEISDENRIEAASTLAQAYIKTKQYENAIAPLSMAIELTKDHEQKGRYLYIKGQLFEELHQKDSANATFDKIIALNRRSPRIYMIHSYMEKGKNDDLKTDKHTETEVLTKMLEDRENRPYLDVINYRMAEYYREREKMPKALTYYNAALQTNLANHNMKYRIYKTVGNYYFDEAEYKTAGAYYDSTMVNLPEASREYRTFKRKRLNLNDVIFYEDIAQKNDSILHLVRMDSSARKAYFKTYTDSLKADAVAEAKKAEKDAKRAKMSDMFASQQSQAGGPSGAFYFYDANQVAAGKQVFGRIWGKRELQDDWRTKKGHVSKKEEKEEEKQDFMAIIEANPNFKPETYLKTIPDDPHVIDSISDDRNFAYYQLGVIYNEKFKEYELAANKLENLLKSDPEERLILPSKYNLYKIYEKLEDKSKMAKWKEDILTNHPDSRYAEILRNPESLKNSGDSPEKVYYRIYKTYKAGHYQEALTALEDNITVFTGDEIIPKMELLKATIRGRLYGFDAYEKGLNYVALTYPQSKEGKKAEEIVKENLPKLKNAKFVKNAEGDYYLIYPFDEDERKDAEKLEKLINKGIKEFEYTALSTSIDFYEPGKIFLVVHGLRSKMGAEGFGEKMELEKKYKVDHFNIGISAKNYTIILIHKNFDRYVQRFED